MHQAGLVSVTFRPLSPEEIIRRAAEAGLSLIEWGTDVHAPYSDPARLQEIACLQKQYGVSTSSLGSYFKLGLHSTEEIYDYARAARTLGTDVVRIWCGQKNFEDMTDDERDRLFNEAKKAARIAEKTGIVLCAECHNKTVTNCLEGALALMEAVNSPCFGMYWQPNQFKSHEENCHYAKAIAPYVKRVHVFHWIGKERFPLEEGVGLWQEYLPLLGNDLTLLLEFMPDDNPESLPGEAASLKKLIARNGETK